MRVVNERYLDTRLQKVIYHLVFLQTSPIFFICFGKYILSLQNKTSIKMILVDHRKGFVETKAIQNPLQYTSRFPKLICNFEIITRFSIKPVSQPPAAFLDYRITNDVVKKDIVPCQESLVFSRLLKFHLCKFASELYQYQLMPYCSIKCSNNVISSLTEHQSTHWLLLILLQNKIRAWPYYIFKSTQSLIQIFEYSELE